MTVLSYINKANIFSLLSRTHFMTQDFTNLTVKTLSQPFDVLGLNKNDVASRNIYYFMYLALTHGTHVLAGSYLNEPFSIGLVMLLGGILQGYSNCHSQQKLDELQKNDPNSLRGFLSGAITAAICCYATTCVNYILPETIFRPVKDLLSEMILLGLNEKTTLSNAKKWFYGNDFESSKKDDYKAMCLFEGLFVPTRKSFQNSVANNDAINCCVKI